MSFADCIQRAMDANLTSQQRGQGAQDLFREISDEYARHHPLHVAQVMAGQDVKRLLRTNYQIQRTTVLSQIMTERRNLRVVQSANKPEDFPLRIIEGSRSSDFQHNTVVGEMNALRGTFNSAIGSFLAQHSRNLFGKIRNQAKLRDIAKELHGQASGSAEAAAMAKSIKDTMAMARRMFNAAGGNIGELDDFGLPHKHNRLKIQRAGFDDWYQKTEGLLDWARIENFATGQMFEANGLVPTDAVKRSFLKEIYTNIDKDGWNKRTPKWGQGQGQGALFKRHGDKRQLHFKSGDAWFDYNDMFGDADMFTTVTGHLHQMARDIAMMRNLGVDHHTGLDNIGQHVLKRVAGTPVEEKAKANIATAKAMLAHVSGAANAPASEFWATFFGSVRQTMSSAHLGSAMLVSGADSVAMSLAANSVGMNPANVVSRHVALLASSSTREMAAAMSYVADTLADGGNTMMRYLGEAPVHNVTERLNSFVMRAQGLSFWTDMGRVAFQMEFSANLAQARTLGDLEPRLADTLRKRGISDADWELFKTPAWTFTAPNGAKFASARYWREAAEQSGFADIDRLDRIMLTIDGMAQELTEIAVPSMNYEMRARLGGVAQPGSIQGELSRSLLAYKSYGMTFTINQYRQIMAIPTSMGRAKYAAAGLAGFTVMGAVGLQLKELSKGNDPRPMDDVKFWGGAMLQGGGFGIAGDLLASTETRMGGGLLGWVAGPVVGAANDLGGLTFGNIAKAVRGDDVNLGRDVVKTAKRYMPGSTLWQTRAATDRFVWDQLQLLLDPEASQSMSRTAKRQATEKGNEQFWDSGDVMPSRLPDLSSALGR